MIKWHANVDISPGNLHNLANQLVDYTKSKIDQVLQIVLKSRKVSVKVDKNHFVQKRQYHLFFLAQVHALVAWQRDKTDLPGK